MSVKIQAAFVVAIACLALAVGLGGLASAQQDGADDAKNEAERKIIEAAIKKMEAGPKDGPRWFGRWSMDNDGNLKLGAGDGQILEWLQKQPSGNNWAGLTLDLNEGFPKGFAPTGTFPSLRFQDSGDGSGFSGNSFEYQNNNGDVSVKLNGERIDEDRVKETEDAIIVYGEDGKVLHRIEKGRGNQLQTWKMSFSNPDGNATKRPTIGLQMEPVSEALAFHLDVSAEGSILVGGVTEGQPAQRAGLQRFDVITRVDGKSAVSMEELRSIVGEKSEGDTLELRILRRGNPMIISIEVEEQEVQSDPRMNPFGNLPTIGEVFSKDGLRFEWNGGREAAPLPNSPFRSAEWAHHGDSLNEVAERLERLEGRLEKMIEKLEKRIDQRF